MATTRSSTTALCLATIEVASYGRNKLKEEKEEVTELTKRLKVARGRLVAAESVAGVGEERRQSQIGTKRTWCFGASQLQLRPPVEGVDPGGAHRQGQQARGCRWP